MTPETPEPLKASEAVVLQRLLQAEGAAVRKDALHAALLAGPGRAGTNRQIVDVHICRLRQKLPNGAIVTRWGVGYALRNAEAARVLLGQLADDELPETKRLHRVMRDALAACEQQRPAEAALLLASALPGALA